ncbi:MAG TPA: hypothetical protein VF718_08705 [Allosphingosinicella sp.]
MRHDQIAAADTYERVRLPAVWPASTQVAPPPAPERVEAETFQPTPAAPDVPAAAGALLAASYATLIGAFALVTVASAESIMAIAICAFFVLVFFAVPRVFLAVEPKQGRRVRFDRFMSVGMETLTGHCAGRAALVQMMIVPVLLTFGILLIGLARAFLI